MGEDEGCGDEVAESAGLGLVCLNSPVFCKEGEAAFSQAVQRALQHVVGAVGPGQDVAAGRLGHRDDDTVTCALLTRIGQGGQETRAWLQRRQDVAAGGLGLALVAVDAAALVIDTYGRMHGHDPEPWLRKARSRISILDQQVMAESLAK